mmetsp:Transcript_101339/g.285820  ORF Transcript_101339/g.285820 Transcript_101339/m.285820 type:complete len:225 (+) Transcript_101339:552-1226(+)
MYDGVEPIVRAASPPFGSPFPRLRFMPLTPLPPLPPPLPPTTRDVLLRANLSAPGAKMRRRFRPSAAQARAKPMRCWWRLLRWSCKLSPWRRNSRCAPSTTASTSSKKPKSLVTTRSVKALRGATKSARGRLPVQSSLFLCAATHARQQVRVAHAGHRYFASEPHISQAGRAAPATAAPASLAAEPSLPGAGAVARPEALGAPTMASIARRQWGNSVPTAERLP